ncbi:unannotated protein [freshwater metagenome]|uniref:Unannotated protein n=1 Tax=freshwater metagenome TaxID=449393 RepID=A0A6J7P3X0_9ZZZZ
MPEVALGVGGVVQRPVGDGRAGDCGMEDIGSVEHGEGREVPAEGPAPNADAREIEIWLILSEGVKRIDLILEHPCREVAKDRPIPRRPSPRGAATVSDDHREPLIGDPLVGGIRTG